MFEQTIVILRHSERLDHVDPKYKETEEGKKWPFDTPLTANGVKLAREVAVELAKLHEKACFAMVASSPYRRCMETAAEVAKALKLPVIIDQEVGEVWDEAMPQERPPHRSATQLQEMAQTLGMRVTNPVLPEGGFKLFGKRPQEWPETTAMGHKRCIVRMETYIEQSAATQQNFIIVSHAPMVAAMMDLFQRGMCDVEKLDYCARVIATRSTRKSQVGLEHGVYAEQWAVDSKGVQVGINMDATEENHLQFCNEAQQMASKRKSLRTKTDLMFDASLKDLLHIEMSALDSHE